MGYFCVTSEDITEEMVEEYLEHNFKVKSDDNFITKD